MTNRLARARKKLSEYVFRTDANRPASLPWYEEVLRFCMVCRRIFVRNGLFAKSGAMAFISTFSIFPLAAVVLMLLPVFFKVDPAVGTSHSAAAPAAVARQTPTPVAHQRDTMDSSDSVPMMASDETSESVYASEVSDMLFQTFAPETGAGWRNKLNLLFQEFQQSSEAMGGVGIIALFFGALALYNTAQAAFNDIWQAKRRRGRLQSLTVFSGVLLWLPLVVFMSVYVKHMMLKYSERAAGLYSVAIPGLFSLLFFTAIYRYVPTVDVRWKNALVGALVATFLWSIAKISFASYLEHARNLRTLIQTVGAIPYFIIWMYVSWVIVLLGAVVSYTCQNYSNLLAMEVGENVGVVDSLVLLLILCVVGRNFLTEAGGASYNSLRELFPISQTALNEHLTFLETRGYICQRADTDTYIMQKPPERVYLSEFIGSAQRANHLFLVDSDLKTALIKTLLGVDQKSSEVIGDESLAGFLLSVGKREA